MVGEYKGKKGKCSIYPEVDKNKTGEHPVLPVSAP